MADTTLKVHHRPLFRRTIAMLLIAAVLCLSWQLLRTALLPSSIWTGLILFGSVLVLSLFGARKRMNFLPVLKASTWLRIHVTVGVFTVFLFLLHVDLQIPTGLLEWTLAIVFVVVSLSGFVGLFLEKRLPRLMRRNGEALIQERIPQYRRQIREEAHSLVVRAEQQTQSTTIPDFYLEHVEDYLAREAPWWLPMSLKLRRPSHIYHELEARTRYFSPQEHELATELREWIETKENLDYQDASMKLLKGWLFFHVPLGFCLILFGTIHGILALLYGPHG